MTGVRFEIRRDLSVFTELETWWNANPGPRSDPFLRTEWFHLMGEYFLSYGYELAVVLMLSEGDVVGALPMAERRGLTHSLSNSHSEVFDAIGDEVVAEGFASWLRRRVATRLFRVDPESQTFRLLPHPNALDSKLSHSPYIDLRNGADHVWDSVSAATRSDTQRKLRSLAKVGEVVHLDDADGSIPNVFERCLALENEGWKGKSGSAILSDERSATLYRRLAVIARANDWLRLSTLMFDDTLVAFQINLDYEGKRYLLKSSYDESWKRHSPGLVLHWHSINGAADRGLETYELGGESEAWKLRWTGLTRHRIKSLHIGDLGAGRVIGPILKPVASRRFAGRG